MIKWILRRWHRVLISLFFLVLILLILLTYRTPSLLVVVLCDIVYKLNSLYVVQHLAAQPLPPQLVKYTATNLSATPNFWKADHFLCDFIENTYNYSSHCVFSEYTLQCMDYHRQLYGIDCSCSGPVGYFFLYYAITMYKAHRVFLMQR